MDFPNISLDYIEELTLNQPLRAHLPWDHLPEPDSRTAQRQCKYCDKPISADGIFCAHCGPIYSKHRKKALAQTAHLVKLARKRHKPDTQRHIKSE